MTTNRIKVAQVLAGAPIGGAENFYTRLVCSLSKYSSIEQKSYTRPNEYRENLLANAQVETSLHRFSNSLKIINNYSYRKALKQWQPHIVTTYMNRASGLTPKGNYQLVARLGHYYDLKYYRHCDYWIGISKGICDHLIQGGMPSEKVLHIPNFVNEEIQTPIARNSFNTDIDQPLLLAVGRLHTNKGFDTLLRALAKLPEGVLWLAGDGPEKNKLQQLAIELDIQKRIKWLGWRNDVNALMRTADLFICPSRHEGLGSIVGEAWFNECPIIATKSQGPSELIDHEKTGLLTEIDDVHQLGTAISYLLNDSKTRDKLTLNAKKHYLNHYSEKIISQQYINFYQTIAH